MQTFIGNVKVFVHLMVGMGMNAYIHHVDVNAMS